MGVGHRRAPRGNGERVPRPRGAAPLLGRVARDLGGQARSGVMLEQQVAYVYEFEDGMARRVPSYIDAERARAVVGLRR
jgi:hypothetical protein